MKALITGANGFVGRHLIEHLTDLGDEVQALDHHGPEPVDVTDAESVRQRVLSAAPDAVYHLAALSHVGQSWSAPLDVFRVNAMGTLNVLRACIDARVSRVLVVGSADEYGVCGADVTTIDEDMPLQPITPYGASKVAAEVCAFQAYLGEQLGAIRTRSFNHTGPGQSDEFVISSLSKRVVEAERTGASEIRVGNLDAVRDFSDVRDVVRAYRLLVEHADPSSAYNVCSGQGMRVGDLAARLLAMSDKSLTLVVDQELVRPVEVPRLVGSNARLRAATGWEPQWKLDRTLADVLEFWRSKTRG